MFYGGQVCRRTIQSMIIIVNAYVNNSYVYLHESKYHIEKKVYIIISIINSLNHLFADHDS